MNIEEIIKTLEDYIREQFDIGEDPDYNSEVDLFEYGFLDSMGAMEVIAYIEEEYSIEITQKDVVLYPMNTISEIAEVIANKLD
ncbi:MAG: acyl carrier protein [Oscillospiraceae bacterium]|nr:acyl carrier protein [Oscillospiraceae bacterium]